MRWGSLIFDAGCVASVVGVWPRFVEPKLLLTSEIELPLPELRIVHFTDLHFHRGVSQAFLERLGKKINALSPDLIVFTGDFLCYARLEESERLQRFLCGLEAKMGHYCVLGNHDYAAYVSRDQRGNYAVKRPLHPLKGIVRGVGAVVKGEPERGEVLPCAASVPLHADLCALLKDTPFELLENRTVTVGGLNVTGVGEYALGRCDPEAAFAGYDGRYPGLVLAHNPDTFPMLQKYPGAVVLSGHTHGEQIHLPLLRPLSRKLARLENSHLTRGRYEEGGKVLYVNRGIGSFKPFRLGSPPEVLLVRGKGC